jgi:hypothetical protein
VLFECYLDDSKDQFQDISYVCAGFYGNKNAWNLFNSRWQQQLEDEGIEYFKTSECNRLKGQFARFAPLEKPHGKNGAGLVRERLKKVMLDTPGLHGVGCAVPMADYRAVMQHQSADLIFGEKGMYYRAFEVTLHRAVRSSCKSSNDAIAFFHDDGQDFNELRDLYRSYKKLNKIDGLHMKGFLPLDDKIHGEIQVADIFANSVMGTAVGHMTEKDGAHNSNIFMFDRSDLSVWSEELGLKILVSEMAKRKIPAPDSLIKALARFGIKPITSG